MVLEQKRGIESIDLNQTFVFVKAPIESVASAFVRVRQANRWEQDVYDREIVTTGQGFIVFQFREQTWTSIYNFGFVPGCTPLEKKDAQTLSSLLQTRTVYYRVSDTGGYIGYELYENGNFIEMLDFEEDISFYFQSQNRQLRREDMGSVYGFIYDFMVEQDIYIPAIRRVENQQGYVRLLGPELENLERSDFERIDYLTLG
ncbi:hypothetical protein C7Y66_20980 [Chroococcidiopsis sp. CCALA 051]|nr:hypothetical protein C7Y66_20980 [Chroococcidiopsis sp. CCALA 051]